MAIGGDYGDLATLKRRLSITDNTDDTDLQSALTSASREVEKFCHRQFNKETTATARVYEPLHDELTLVDDFHTTTGLEIAVDDSDDGTFGTVLTSSQYEVRPRNGVVDGEPGWPFWRVRATESGLFPRSRRATVQVTAQWGWTAVPASVTEASLILAEEIFKLKDAPFGVAGYGEFGAVRVRDNPKVARMLGPYRRYTVAVA